MPRINQEKLDKLFIVMRNKKCRLILKHIGERGCKGYAEINSVFKWERGLYGHVIRLMVNSNLIVKDKLIKQYILTRIGVQTLRVIKKYEKLCSEYDLSDCRADGRIKREVVGRKL